MRLSALVNTIPNQRAGAPGDPEISSVTHDSRRAGPGVLFAAFPGIKADGRTFIPDAVARGAAAALGSASAPPSLPIPYIEVENPRRAAGLLAARLAGNPAERLVMVGVTGTSGKTTTTLLVDAMLENRHAVRGLFGTLVYRGAGGAAAEVEAARTTPEATELQPMLAALVAEGGTAATMECSSHALALDRLAGCSFDVAAFLNLSRDHLDFHRGLDDYFEAKTRLFSMLKPNGVAVVNVGDPWGERLYRDVTAPTKIAFALESEAYAPAPVSGRVRRDDHVTHLTVINSLSGEEYAIVSPLLGRPMAENLLAAATIGYALGMTGEEIAPALESESAIPGRMEPIPNTKGLTVLVDYAHKPGALEGALLTSRALAEETHGRVVVVFGCGGERDRGKRPEMGEIAARLADVVVVTSDNPRGEDPESILADVRAGISKTEKEIAFLVDRREAIARALAAGRRGDVVLIAGKGHETYQVIGNRKLPFDDRVVARELLAPPPEGRA